MLSSGIEAITIGRKADLILMILMRCVRTSSTLFILIRTVVNLLEVQKDRDLTIALHYTAAESLHALSRSNSYFYVFSYIPPSPPLFPHLIFPPLLYLKATHHC